MKSKMAANIFVDGELLLEEQSTMGIVNLLKIKK